MINNKALVCSYVAKIFADGTKYHESIKESDNIGYIYDAVEELLNTKLSKQEKRSLSELVRGKQIAETMRIEIVLCRELRRGAFVI